eukprot:TRINITY_DN632_c2_g1_i1.p3 TRINITY_DN632_c2_g1~~TRINITY_DN632_c2_g1_i1.p3  ORF type:complete len:203 (+),score=27.84 TRINITY_DN632_c2_g1_i1:72-680(+)
MQNNIFFSRTFQGQKLPQLQPRKCQQCSRNRHQISALLAVVDMTNPPQLPPENSIVQIYEKQAEIDQEKAKLDYIIQQQLNRVKAQAESKKTEILISAERVENQLRQRLVEQEANLEAAANRFADDATTARIADEINSTEEKIFQLKQLVNRQLEEVDQLSRLSQAKLMGEKQRIDKTALSLQGQLAEFLREAPPPGIQTVN